MAAKQKHILFALSISLSFLSVSACATQAKLKTESFKVCGQPVGLMIAKTNSARAFGLMERSQLPAKEGMLFIFRQASLQYFWMKDVWMDLDIGYFDSQGKLITSMTMKKESATLRDEARARYSSERPAQFAVEMNPGFYAKLKNLKSCRLEPVPKIDESVE